MSRYYDKDGQVIDGLLVWARRFEDNDYKRVAQDKLADGDIVISTVWLGLDHSWGVGPPLIFETMIFGGPDDQWQDRYTTLEQAQAGHKRVVEEQQQKLSSKATT